MTTLVRLEIVRSLRNKKFMFFTVIYPSVLFLLIAGPQSGAATIPGTDLTTALYYTVAMASFGALTAVLMGNAERIAKEREKGWVRQLRLTPLPGRGYVLAKIASSAVVTLPSIVIVLIVAAVTKDVRMALWQWCAVAGAVWAGSLVFAALGVALGYVASGDTVRPVTMITYFGLSILGGLWMPTTVYPDWLRTLCDWLPTRSYAALGQAIEVGNAPHSRDVALLAAYFLLFAAAAAWLYRKDTRKA